MSGDIIALPTKPKSRERLEAEKSLCDFARAVRTINALGQEAGRDNLVLDFVTGMTKLAVYADMGVFEEIAGLTKPKGRAKRRQRAGGGS